MKLRYTMIDVQYFSGKVEKLGSRSQKHAIEKNDVE